MNLTPLAPLLCAAVVLTGCGSDHTALDGAGTRACQEAFLAGDAQLNGQPDAETLHLIKGYQESATSQTQLVVAWRTDHASLGSAARKTQQDADEAVRVLLIVCRSTGFKPAAPSTPPTTPTPMTPTPVTPTPMTRTPSAPAESPAR